MVANDDEELPARLMGLDIGLISLDPLVAVLRLDTDKGGMEIAVNRPMAGLLATALVELLSASEDDVDESELN